MNLVYSGMNYKILDDVIVLDFVLCISSCLYIRNSDLRNYSPEENTKIKYTLLRKDSQI